MIRQAPLRAFLELGRVLSQQLNVFSARRLAGLINHCIWQTPEAVEKIREHQDKVLSLQLGAWQATYRIHADAQFYYQSVEQSSRVESKLPEADLVIIIPLSALTEAFAEQQPLLQAHAEIHGDMRLARCLSWCLENVHIDLDKELMDIFGDRLGFLFAAFIRKQMTLLRTRGQMFAQHSHTWLNEAPRGFVTRRENEALQTRISKLRDAIARMA